MSNSSSKSSWTHALLLAAVLLCFGLLQKAHATCGLPGSLWYSGSSCTPGSFGAVIDSTIPPPYFLVNSGAAVPYCRSIYMNFYQFPTVAPPNDTTNFTLVLNIYDTAIPAALAGYWGTDGVNYPNQIFALINPDNGTDPLGYNTYTYYFTTGVPVSSLSVAFIGFNNPAWIYFHETSLIPTYNFTGSYNTPAVYATPFPVTITSAVVGNHTVQLFFTVYTSRSVYFRVTVVQFSEALYTLDSSAHPVSATGTANFTVSGLTNFAVYEFAVAVVDSISGLVSSAVVSNEYEPAPPGSTNPCGLDGSLWSSSGTSCYPPSFGAVIDVTNDPSPYGLVNSPVAVAYCRSVSMNFFQFPTVHPPAGVTNFTFVLDIKDTAIPAAVGGYWGTDGINFPNFIFSLIHPENGTFPTAYNTYLFYFSTGVPVTNLSIAFVGFNNPAYITFGASSIIPNYDTSRDFSVAPPYLIPFPVKISSGVATNRTIQLFFNAFTTSPVYFIVAVLENSQVLRTLNTAAQPVSISGLTSVNITGLTNWHTYQFVVTSVDVVSGLQSRNVTSGSYTPSIPGTTAPCGLDNSLWNSVTCTPTGFANVIDVTNDPAPYGLVNSPMAVPYCRAVNMNFFQFPTVHPPSDTANFTLVMNVYDTYIPAAVGGYWGTDGVNFPNFIFSLVHPENGTNPLGYNTYYYYFSTGVPVANLSVALVGFNNPSVISFHASSLLATYDNSLDFSVTQPPYLIPFPVKITSGVATNGTIQLFFNAFNVGPAYFIVTVQQNSISLWTLDSSAHPVISSGVTSVNITGLTNWASYQFVVTMVDVATGVKSRNVTSGVYIPSIPGTTAPCGLDGSLWISSACTPGSFGDVIPLAAEIPPYGLVNSPVAVPYCRTLPMNFYQFATVHPPSNVANFTLVLNIYDTAIPAGVAGYWGTDGVNFPNFIFALIDPNNGTIPSAYNTYTYYFTTGVPVANLSVAFIGFNNPSYIYFHETSLLPNYDTSRDFSAPAPYLIPYPAIITSTATGNQLVRLTLTVYTARPVYLIVTVLRSSVAQYSQDSSARPVSTSGSTTFNVTGLTSGVTYTFMVTVVDSATGLMSRNVTSGSVTPTAPPTTTTTTTTTTPTTTTTTTTTRSTTTTTTKSTTTSTTPTTTTATTTTTTGVPSSWWARVSCEFDLSSAAFPSLASVANWATSEGVRLSAGAMGVNVAWVTLTVVSVSSAGPNSASEHTQGSGAGAVSARKLRVSHLSSGVGAGAGVAADSSMTPQAADWLLFADITIRPMGSSQTTQDDVNAYANTLVSALNTAGSQLSQQLAAESVYVVRAELTTQGDGSSSFFSTAWHAGVVAAVVVIGVLLLLGTAAFMWKRWRTAKGGSSGVDGTSAGAKAVGKYEQHLETADGEADATNSAEGELRTVQMAIMGSAGANGDSADAEPEPEPAETGELTAGASSSGETDDPDNSLNHTGAVHLHS